MPSPRRYKMFIDGEWCESESGETFDVLNPFNQRIIATVPKGNSKDAEAAIDAAKKSFDGGAWSRKSPAERSDVIWRLADMVQENSDSLAKLESMNVGKTLKYARNSDLPFIVDNLKFFAGACRNMEGKASGEYVGRDGTSIIRREPVGVVAAIVPWNYPLFIAVWKIAPALAAGNSIVLKPASNTPLTLLEFARLVEKAGVPDGVFNVVTGPGEVVGTELAKSEKVDMITLTGDTSTGKKIAELASETLKRVHLELGGKAPLVVLKDADMEMAAKGAVTGAFWNGGQDCTAVTRVYVHESQHDELVRLMVAEAKKFRLGDPMKESTDMGPMVSAKQRDRVESYIKSGVKEGAKIAYGGEVKGNFVTPTIFTGVTQNMRICQEEIFGPVVAVVKYRTLDEAVRGANGVVYGLAASVYGSNIRDCMDVANRLDFGTVWVNEHGVLASEMPHGGFKQSGFGKDLSMYSLEEYTRVKHIYIDLTGTKKRAWHSAVYGETT